jgi:hypothetical protein
MDLSKIIFENGLYLNEEEVIIYGIKTHNGEFKELNFEKYISGISDKLFRAINNEFMALLYSENSEEEIALKIYENPEHTMKDVFNSEFESLSKTIRYCLEDKWKLNSNTLASLEINSPKILASQLVESEPLNNLLYDFYERIEVLNENDTLENHYLEEGLIEEEDAQGYYYVRNIDNVLENQEYQISFSEYSNYLIEIL